MAKLHDVLRQALLEVDKDDPQLTEPVIFSAIFTNSATYVIDRQSKEARTHRAIGKRWGKKHPAVTRVIHLTNSPKADTMDSFAAALPITTRDLLEALIEQQEKKRT